MVGGFVVKWGRGEKLFYYLPTTLSEEVMAAAGQTVCTNNFFLADDAIIFN